MPPNMKPNMNPGTVVLITGCSSGFGLLMAETLARKNYHVFATMSLPPCALSMAGMRTPHALSAH